MSTKQRLLTVLTVLWLLVVLVAGVQDSDMGRSFDWPNFTTILFAVGLVPPAVIWGIVWIRAAK